MDEVTLGSRPEIGPCATAEATSHLSSFSIVIPTFQRRDTLRLCIASLCHLDYPAAVEIVVVVDGATDGTADMLRAMECKFPLRVIEVENGGAARARNIGAAAARNDILMFLDDDMIAEPDLLERHASHYATGADAVTGAIFVDERSPDNFITESISRWICAPRPFQASEPFEIYTGQMSVRRSVFDALGGFDPAFTSTDTFGHEDTDFGVRLLERYCARHEPLAVTRMHYVVGPRESMSRAPLAAAADLRFAARFPQLSDRMFEQRGRYRWKTRLLYWPLSRIPFVSRALSATALFVAERAMPTRFRSSRWLRYFFFGARAVSYWSAIAAGGGIPASRSLLVLCYHAIVDQSDDPVLAPYGIAREQFVAQLESLAARGYRFIGPDALAAFLGDNGPLPQRAVLLTFDDCYTDLLPVAREVLRPRGIEAIAFAVTGTVTRTNEWDQPYGARRLDLLGPDELRELAALGVEVGSHSRSHADLRLLTDRDLRGETEGSAQDVAALGLPRARYFAYPYGSRDARTRGAARDAGYRAAFSLLRRRATDKSDPFDLPRVIVLAKDRGWRFRFKTGAPRLSGMIEHPRATVVSLVKKLVGRA